MTQVKKISYIFIAIILLAAAVEAILFLSKINTKLPEIRQKQLISVGIIATDKKTIEKYQIFIDYLNKKSDNTWYLVPLKDYGTFVNQLELKEIKTGFIGSYIAYRLINEGIGTPVVREEKNGVSTYAGYIFTRTDSGLNKIEDLEGKKFAYVDSYTSAGYIFPYYLLKSKGYDPENFFNVTSFLGSHDKAILSVASGEYDGGAAKDSSWNKLMAANPDMEKEMQIIEKEGPFPDQTFMVNDEFEKSEIIKLKNLLLKMPDSEEGRDYLSKMNIDRFIATEESDFSKIKKLNDFIAE